MTDYHEQAIKDLDDFLDARDKKKSTYSSATWEYAVTQREARLRLEDALRDLIFASAGLVDEYYLRDARAALDAGKELPNSLH